MRIVDWDRNNVSQQTPLGILGMAAIAAKQLFLCWFCANLPDATPDKKKEVELIEQWFDDAATALAEKLQITLAAAFDIIQRDLAWFLGSSVQQAAQLHAGDLSGFLVDWGSCELATKVATLKEKAFSTPPRILREKTWDTEPDVKDIYRDVGDDCYALLRYDFTTRDSWELVRLVPFAIQEQFFAWVWVATKDFSGACIGMRDRREVWHWGEVLCGIEIALADKVGLSVKSGFPRDQFQDLISYQARQISLFYAEDYTTLRRLGWFAPSEQWLRQMLAEGCRPTECCPGLLYLPRDDDAASRLPNNAVDELENWS